MPGRWFVSRAAACCCIGALIATAIAARSSHDAAAAPPDWSAPYRWVHVDNVDTSKAAVFEDARREWLTTLVALSPAQDDGRPLFWCATDGAARTYFTFHPFARFADLDARREAARRADEAAGAAAVAKYDAGDAALVAPHYSQVWRRDPDFDFAPSDVAALDETSAGAALMERRRPELHRETEIRGLWRQLTSALTTARHPLACRGFWSALGDGRTILLWLAPDRKTLDAAPPLREAVARALGAERATQLCEAWARVCPLEESRTMERRADLSHPAR